MDLKIKIVKNKTELNKCFSVRYNVFVKEPSSSLTLSSLVLTIPSDMIEELSD